MKLTKENVYVKVTTLEESQELLKVLTESGEDVNKGTALGLSTGIDEDGDNQLHYPCISFINHRWYGFTEADGSKVKVSIQQLKEILRPEKQSIDIKHVKDFISILGNIILDSPDSDLSKLKTDLENKVNRTQLDTDIEALKEKYKDFKITVIVE